MIKPVYTIVLLWLLSAGFLYGQEEKGRELSVEGMPAKKEIVFENHGVYADYRLGVVDNITDGRTTAYIDHYWHLSFGVSLYIKRLILSYSINPSTVGTVKKEFSARNGYTLRPYHHGFWGGGRKGYWLNIVKNNFEVAYEIPLNKKYSLTPAVGFFINRFNIINDSLHGFRYHLSDAYGLNFGCSIKRYFTIAPNAQTFVAISAYANDCKLSRNLAQLGDRFYSFSIQCGIKFHPTGAVLETILKAAFKSSR